MNFLAHLFLADRSAESLIGNLAGDFVKGRLRQRFTPGIRGGIMAHRRIDAFTDTHPEIAAIRRVLIPTHGHYARVIGDVFLDYFLASSFEAYADEPLPDFLARVYVVLDAHIDHLPGRLQQLYPIMRDQQWLLSYQTVEGIHNTLANMSRRIPRQPHLETATQHLVESRVALEGRFKAFFPEVVRYARTLPVEG